MAGAKNVTVDAETKSQLDSFDILVRQAELLAVKYDAVVANPPYRRQVLE